MYGLHLLSSSNDVYAQHKIDERLKIKTHYEGLDIAQSNKIFYLQFSLPANIPDRDLELQEILKHTEQNHE